MGDSPAAEVAIDRALVQALLHEQAPHLAGLPLHEAGAGWDNSMWRLGSALAVRLPRREASAPLITHEQQWLASIVARVAEASSAALPVPLVHGRPGHGFPWGWSVVPWIPGSAALGSPRAANDAWAGELARVLAAIHVPAPSDAPHNPYRGRPLHERAEVIGLQIASLAGAWPAATVTTIANAWQHALDAPPWAGAPLWLHGDLHPGNLLVRDRVLLGIIDFGDVTSGDPAYDLAVAWLAFTTTGRAEFRASLGPRYSSADWIRARGRAAAFAAVLRRHSDDNPNYGALADDVAAELCAEDADSSGP